MKTCKKLNISIVCLKVNSAENGLKKRRKMIFQMLDPM